MRLEDLKLDGADCRLDGLHIAKCIKTTDPKAQERVWVRVIGVHDMESTDPEYCIEARHIAPSKGTSGEFPDKDDLIYGLFMQNDPNVFYYLGYVRCSG
jgi:hypothetical protein